MEKILLRIDLKALGPKAGRNWKVDLSKGKQHVAWLVGGCLLPWGMQCPICLLLWQQQSAALWAWGIRGYASGTTSNKIIRWAKSWTQSYLQNLCKKNYPNSADYVCWRKVQYNGNRWKLKDLSKNISNSSCKREKTEVSIQQG